MPRVREGASLETAIIDQVDDQVAIYSRAIHLARLLAQCHDDTGREHIRRDCLAVLAEGKGHALYLRRSLADLRQLRAQWTQQLEANEPPARQRRFEVLMGGQDEAA
jgi:hypothetical protein